MSRSIPLRLVGAAALVVALVNPAAAAPPATTATLLLASAPIPGANGLAVDANGTLHAGSAGVGVFVLDKETGAITGFYGPGGAWGADDLDFGPDGSMAHTAIMNGTVGLLSPDGKTHTILNKTPLPGVNPVTWSDDGRLFVGTAFFGDALYEFDPTGATEPRLINEGLGLNGFDWADGFLWAPRMTTGEVVKIDPDTGETTTVASGITGPAAVDVGPDGLLYVTDSGAGQIVRVDPATGEKTVIGKDFGPGLDNMAIDATGRMFVSNSDTGRIVELLADGSVREVSPAGLISGPGGLTVLSDASGASTVYIADLFSLHSVDAATGTELPIVFGSITGSGPGAPMTVGAYGDKLVTSSWIGGAVSVWDPAAGKLVTSYPYDATAGIVPINAIGFGNDIIVADLAAAGPTISRIDGTTGEKTALAPMAVPSGLATNGTDLWAADWAIGTVSQIIKDGAVITPLVVAQGLQHPEGMAVAADGSLLVAETGTGRVVSIDPATGAVTALAEGLDLGAPGSEGQPPTSFLAGIAVDPSGSIYVSANGLYKLTPAS
jgi:sugar lactone lactonase YvrE